MEELLFTDIFGLAPNSSFVMSRFVYSKELKLVEAAFSVGVFKMLIEKAATHVDRMVLAQPSVHCTLCVKITCLKSRVLLSSFAASITRIYCARSRTTVEDHGCTGQGKHATQTTTQRFRLQFNGFAWLLLPIVTCYREFY